MGLVFISYRRADQPHAAAAIDERLGAHQVFRDTRTMVPGAQFPQALTAARDRADAPVAVIGPGWAAPTVLDCSIRRATGSVARWRTPSD